MRIRPATIEDSLGIAETNVAAWHGSYRGIIPDEMLAARQVEPLATRIREGWNPDAKNLVAVDETDRVVGHAREQRPPGLAAYDVELGSLYVRPEFARQGIGTALVKAIVTKFVASGAKSLCIQTFRDNTPSRNFYTRLGGKLVAEGQWGGCPTVWFGWPDMRSIVWAG